MKLQDSYTIPFSSTILCSQFPHHSLIYEKNPEEIVRHKQERQHTGQQSQKSETAETAEKIETAETLQLLVTVG